MPPIIKESTTSTATPETVSRAASAPVSSAESAPRQQAVAVEVPVTVNGARAMEGSNKREPFSETTKTVLVFGAGAVIRLSSSVAPGQLVFLTNERTKKEVVCQVVKSKNYRNVSGYVELEFTEAAVGFWGMRFPGDRIGSAAQPAPAAVRPPALNGSQVPTLVRPAAAKIGELPASSAPGNGAAKPSTPAAVTASVPPKLVEPKLVAPKAPVPPKATSPGTPVTAASSSIVPPPLDSASLLGASKPKSAEPAVPAASPTAAPKITPESTVPQSASPNFPTFELQRTSDKPATIFASSPEAPPDLSKVDLSSLAPFFEVKPAAASVVPPPPQVQVPIDPETETLKQHTARLQEELSTMNFAEATSDSPVDHSLEAPSFPLAEKEQVHEKRAQILEPSNAPLPAPILAELDEPAKAAPAVPISSLHSLDSLEQEELKIPSWLEPLARNAAAPSSTQELVLREKAKRIAEQPEQPEIEELTAEPKVAVEEAKVSELRIPEFGSALPIDIDNEERPVARSSTKSGNSALLYAAMGAGIVLVAFAGWWYMNQQSGGVRASLPDTQAPAVSAPATMPLQTKPQEETASKTNLPAQAGPPVSPASLVRSDSTAQANSGSKLSGPASGGSPATPTRNTQLSSNSLGGAIVSKSSTEQPGPASAQMKKPSLGEVRLATPKVLRNQHGQNGAEMDAGLSLEEVQAETDADSLAPSLKLANKEPSAPAPPLAVGGDVKQAKLISSVQPAYPAMAKSQHVSGNVTIDALIDATGRVTTMKVVSGPSLLQQAAMDALKQWKYQPAMLDGKAVPMHLSVTIQFHLQ
jgi:TonB family protein